jgi:hypothetical protein
MLSMRPLIPLLVSAIAWAQPPQASVTYPCVPDQLEAAGLTCSQAHPCTVYLELAAMDLAGARMIVSGNLHTKDVTLSSILLASEDGGRTWTEPHARYPGAGLEQIQFVDYENGWIGGQTLQGRPRDPFLLVTRDGGKSWRRHPLFEEGRTGVIQHFWFDNKTTGSLVIDRMQSGETGSRYELYESLTGGESWLLRQVSSRQLAIKRAGIGEANPGWRLRADAPARSYFIEQAQAGDRWRAVAAFPILVATCRAAEPSLAEPEPEPPPSSHPAPRK